MCGFWLHQTARSFDDHRVPRDAQPIPYSPAGERVDPRNARIRIRINGTWYNGYVQRWTRLPDGTWAAWLCYQADPEHPTIAPVWGWYLYDPETIIPVGPTGTDRSA